MRSAERRKGSPGDHQKSNRSSTSPSRDYEFPNGIGRLRLTNERDHALSEEARLLVEVQERAQHQIDAEKPSLY